MDKEYLAQPMSWADAPVAYPLVYLHDASITLDDWLDFVHRRIDSNGGSGGLIVIRDRRGLVHALFCYRADLDLRGRNQLCIAQLIVAHLPGSQINHAVIRSIDQIAASLVCQTITIEQPFQLGTVPKFPAADLFHEGITQPGSPQRH